MFLNNVTHPIWCAFWLSIDILHCTRYTISMGPKVKLTLGDSLKNIAEKLKTLVSKARGVVKSGLRKGTLALLCLATFASFSSCQKNIVDQNYLISHGYNYSADWYSTYDEIESYARQLGADMSIMKLTNNKIFRRVHNGDEPIYVAFDKSIQDDFKPLCEYAVDHIFSILGKINENYRYQIVDDLTPYQNNRSYILFSDFSNYYEEKPKTTKAVCDSGHTKSEIGFIPYSTIYIRQDELKSEFGEKWKTNAQMAIIHETCHSIGDDDVYSILDNPNKYSLTDLYDNTFMREHFNKSTKDNSVFMLRVYPEDVKRYCAAYALPGHSNDEKYIQYLKDFCSEYEKSFYDKYLEVNRSWTYVEGNVLICENERNDEFDYVKLQVKNKKYKINIIKSGEVIESITGEASDFQKPNDYSFVDDYSVTVLKNIDTKYLYRYWFEAETHSVAHATLYLHGSSNEFYMYSGSMAFVMPFKTEEKYWADKAKEEKEATSAVEKTY